MFFIVPPGIDAIDAIAHGKPSAMAASPALSSASLSFSWHCPVTLSSQTLTQGTKNQAEQGFKTQNTDQSISTKLCKHSYQQLYVSLVNESAK